MRRVSRCRDHRRDDSGQVTVLIVGFTLILLVLVAVVVDASAAFLRRQGLNALADASALAATDGVQGQEVYTSGLGERAQIDPASATAFVQAYLTGAGARAKYPGLRVTVTTRANQVVVRLSAPLDLPFHVQGVGPRPVITGTAASEVSVTR